MDDQMLNFKFFTEYSRFGTIVRSMLVFLMHESRTNLQVEDFSVSNR